MEASIQSQPAGRANARLGEPGVIPQRLDQIQENINEAHGLVDGLENRLMAISSGDVPELGILGEVREEASPVAERLTSHRDGIQTLINRLRNLDTRLDL